jgi:S1-C subfamily serine protease
MESFQPFQQPPSPPPPPPRRAGASTPTNRWLVLVSLAMALGMGVVILWRSLAQPQQPVLDPRAQPRPVAARGDLAEDERATIELFKERSHSVVYITTTASRRDAVTFNIMEIPRGTGTGVVWDNSGHIVTNYHVVEHVVDGVDRARVAHGDKVWNARLVGAAPDKDLAVLKIDASASGLRPLLIGSSHDLQVGQKVFAIGNPFGLDQTLTTGVISGLGRQINALTGRVIQDVIQTDAAINPGNSGGPLLDSGGRMIGLNTAIISPSGAYSGVGFAIPVDTVNRIVPQLIRHGRIVRPGLGVHIGTDQLLQQYGMEGVLVLRVQPGSGAAAAGMQGTRFDENGGIQLGDIIVGVDDTKIEGAEQLFRVLETQKVGDTVAVTVLRDARTPNERTEELRVRLQSLP